MKCDAALAEEGMNQNVQSLQGVVNRYYRWNLGVFPIQKGKRILDLGCGPGLYFHEIMRYSPDLYLAADYSWDFLARTRVLFGTRTNCRACQLNLTDDVLPEAITSEKLDYVICLDVLEHIQDDEKALQNIRRIVTVTGTPLVFLRVPALQFCFGRNDEAVGHFRRYSAESLGALLAKCGFTVRRLRYQNLSGILPWYVVGKVAKRSLAVSQYEGRLFDRLVPLLRFVENVVPPPLGLSLYCVCSVKV